MIRLFFVIFLFFVSACTSSGKVLSSGSKYVLSNVANVKGSDYTFYYPQGWTLVEKGNFKSTVVSDGVRTCDIKVADNQKNDVLKNLNESQKELISRTMMDQILKQSSSTEVSRKFNIEDELISDGNVKGVFVTVSQEVPIKNSKIDLKMPTVSYIFSNIKGIMFLSRCTTLGNESEDLKKLVIDIAKTVSKI